MLIERGFVVAVPSQEGLPAGSGKFVVEGGGRIINPEREGETLYFTSESYADSYGKYVSAQEPQIYEIVRVENCRSIKSKQVMD